MRQSRRLLVSLAISLVLPLACIAPAVWGAVAEMHSGYELEGNMGRISGVATRLAPGQEADTNPIVLLDDQLRRMFISNRQLLEVRTPDVRPPEKIVVEQPAVFRAGGAASRLASVGPISRITQFDEYGRRIVTMISSDGAIDIIQGITMVTPDWTRLETLRGGRQLVWETYVATSTIPREVLSKVLMREIDPENPDQRLKLVRLYVQAERYRDAQDELQGVVEDFPELANLQDEIRALRQISAQRLLDEIELRSDAGQHYLAVSMLQGFPDEGVAGNLLLAVRDKVREYDRLVREIADVNTQLAELTAGLDDEALRQRLEPMIADIAEGLSVNTHARMAAYRQLAEDGTLDPEQKIALALSGWLVGSDQATENLAVATSLYQVRELMIEYMNSENAAARAAILQQMAGQEGATPQYMALLAANMKPPRETPGLKESFAAPDDAQDAEEEEAKTDPPGFFKLSVPGIAGSADIEYYVQLPPEYDPYRRYPVIVTLNGTGTSPQQQIDWWAGGYNAERHMRLGQATRHGYVVIAPVWHGVHQREYEYSGQEHAAVLYSLRDACRRFAIDTDRVFLTGHSMGGTAAWDIGLAHPDLWAGVMPIVARPDRYILRYWENATMVPFYFVGGELDSDWLGDCSTEFDRYLRHTGFDTVIVAYQGRGHEHFIDEIYHLFDWMEVHRRDFFPKEFEASSMRDWDNFFFWVELNAFPSASVVPPAAWPPDRGARPAVTEVQIPAENNIGISTAADDVTVYFTPELVNFDERVTVRVGSMRNVEEVRPAIEVMLEDLRTRSDRLHPFWAKLHFVHGRVQGG